MKSQSASFHPATDGPAPINPKRVTWRLVLLFISFAVCFTGLGGGLLMRVKAETMTLRRIEWYERASSFAGVQPAAGWQYRRMGMHEEPKLPHSAASGRKGSLPARTAFHGALVLYAALTLSILYRGWQALQPLCRIIPESPRGRSGILTPRQSVSMLFVPVLGLFWLFPSYVNLAAFGRAAANMSDLCYEGPSRGLVLTVLAGLFLFPLVLVACDLGALFVLKGMVYGWYRVAAGFLWWAMPALLLVLHYTMCVKIERMAIAQSAAWKSGVFADEGWIMAA